MMTLSSTQSVVEAMRNASQITLTAYTLPDGDVRSALVTAAQHGAHVRVRLEGFIYKDDGSVAATNHAAIDSLVKAGVDAKLVHLDQSASDAMLHLKGAVVDNVLFLDDRNWPGDGEDTIVRDSFADDAQMVRDAAAGAGDSRNKFFAVRKRDALESEARLLNSVHRGDDVIVESESFGDRNVVYKAIDSAALRGAHVRLLVSKRDAENNARELQALEKLRRDGVQAKLCDGDEKFAVVNGTRGWVGSANATMAFNHPDQLDWGMRTDAADILGHVTRAFNTRWTTVSG